MKSPFLGLVAALATLLALPAAAPAPRSTLAQLYALGGKPATAITVEPIGDAPMPLVTAGKPTVVIAFASWCFACMNEMPRNLADYAKYKDRVNFVGIDYMDAQAAGDATIAKFAIPFPVARDGGSGAPAPA